MFDIEVNQVFQEIAIPSVPQVFFFTGRKFPAVTITNIFTILQLHIILVLFCIFLIATANLWFLAISQTFINVIKLYQFNIYVLFQLLELYFHEP